MNDHEERVLSLDDLLGPIPSQVEEDATPTETNPPPSGYVYRESDSYKLQPASYSVSDKNPSKSQRIRTYLESNPEARNRDVVEALTEYGITAADVSNAKAQLKRKGTPAKRGRPSASSEASLAKAAASLPSSSSDNAGHIAMNEIEAALNFVRQMGSLARAQQLLVIIQQIQHL